MNDTTRSANGKIRIPALVAVAADLERTLHATTSFADVALDAKDVRLAFDSLALAVNRAIDGMAAMGGKLTLADLGDDLTDAACRARMDALMAELVGKLPPIRGGGPDDFEEIDPAVFGDAWPEYPDPELDGYTWEPTPDHILAAECDARAAADDSVDWQAYQALSLGVSEADHYAVHACV